MSLTSYRAALPRIINFLTLIFFKTLSSLQNEAARANAFRPIFFQLSGFPKTSGFGRGARLHWTGHPHPRFEKSALCNGRGLSPQIECCTGGSTTDVQPVLMN